MKYINTFSSTESFESAKETLDSLEHYVAYDSESDKVYLKKVEIPLNDASIVGDIVMYDKQGNKMVHCKPSEYSIETYPEAQYTPIGVVIIPSSHTDDGKDVIMSLAAMSAKTPDKGITTTEDLSGQTSSDYYLRFGGEGRELTGFTTNIKVPYIASCPLSGTVSQFGDVAYDTINADMSQEENYRIFAFSNDMYSDDANIKNPNNANEGYFKMMINELNKQSKVLLIPSPYTSDGGKNTDYFQAPSDGGTNILADFDGSVINKKYLEQVQGGEEWKTSPTINNASGVQNFPYIQCCWRYHTDGTKQGDWYVPSVGECGYICSKMKEIQAGYAKMKEVNKTVIDLTNMEEASISHWNSNYFSNIYGLGFVPIYSASYCGDGPKDNVNSAFSVAVCRVSLRF